MLEGPSNQESSVEDEQECVITPSTTVKFSAALKERNRINVMRNSLLLIGNSTAHSSRPALRAVLFRPSSGDIMLLFSKLQSSKVTVYQCFIEKCWSICLLKAYHLFFNSFIIVIVVVNPLFLCSTILLCSNVSLPQVTTRRLLMLIIKSWRNFQRASPASMSTSFPLLQRRPLKRYSKNNIQQF